MSLRSFPGRTGFGPSGRPLASGDRTRSSLRGRQQRTAFATADLFLERNGAILAVEEDEAVAFMVQVAQGEKSVGQVARWIEEHLRNA